MNKEKVLQLVSEALDKDAYVHIHLTSFTSDISEERKQAKEESHLFISRAVDALGGGQRKVYNSDESERIRVEKGKVDFVVSYHPYMEEDVLLGGDTDGTPLGTSDDRAC